jgi:ABC-type glycerol-3-phosphate transport system permease component
MGMRGRDAVWQTVRYTLMLLLAAVLLLPLVWLFVSSLRPADEIFRYASEIGLRTLVPDTITLENYRAALASDFPRAILNSAVVTLSTIVLGIIVNSLAGFAFAVFQFPGRNVLFVLVLATFMMPFESIVIPLYTLMRAIGWTDTYRALILPEVASGLVVFLFRQFFAQVPRELFEAARVDGASWLQIYWKVALPLSWPTVATATLMIFILQWEAFFWPLVVASSPDYVLIQVAIARYANFEQMDWGGMFATASIAIGFALIPFLMLQRFYIRTIVYSGLRG